MTSVDDGGGPRSMRAQLREQARELGRLRQQLAARDGAEPPALEQVDGPSEEQPDPAVQLAEARAATAAAEAEAEALSRLPVGVTPETVRAAALVDQAAAGASPPTDGLEGMLTRLQDRGIPYPQLLEEMRSFGFRDAPGAEG